MEFLMTARGRLLSIPQDLRGQDFIEYALMAGCLALTVGAVMPDVTTGTSQIFGHITSMIDVLVKTDTLPINFGN